jgi:dihydrofolate synthase/folylpolyglutamate synthase
VGEHQALNCGLALGIIDKLTERGFECPPDKAVQGLATTKLAGRFELVQWSPRVLFDGAHNPQSVKVLMRAVAQYVSYDALVVVFGCAADKDANAMLHSLAGAADKVIFTRASDNKRAADPHALHRFYQSLDGPMSMVEPSLPAAMELAKRSSNLSDVICVTGSFYVVGEARRWLGNRLKGPRR